MIYVVKIVVMSLERNIVLFQVFFFLFCIYAIFSFSILKLSPPPPVYFL